MINGWNAFRLIMFINLRVYQAKNGGIYATDKTGLKFTVFTIRQLKDLAVDYESLDDFDKAAFDKYYSGGSK